MHALVSLEKQGVKDSAEAAEQSALTKSMLEGRLTELSINRDSLQ